ncbi:MAG TPA: beta-ketoacyl-ACP synthase III [Terriglobia bacterium]|jgi:3-oxoacyl-[acyl-carrier-protein] synthase-3|nr:beta-ketoacyl-ACP synthase III [Terriglobia bacterium]
MISAGILGTGSALPEKVITNRDLEKMVDTSDQWITERTGIKERRQAAPGETTSHLSVKAARKALSMAGLSAKDLDLIICSTISPDMPLPSTAAFIQHKLGARACCSFDLAAACSGFLFGLTVAEQFIRTGKAKYVLVVGAELLSRYLDYTDRATCVIFGDGVAAGIVGPVEPPSGILAAEMHTDGQFAEHLYIPAGGATTPASIKSVESGGHYIKMRGNELFKVAVRSLEDVSRRVMAQAKVCPEQLNLFIPHQANQRITDAVRERLGVSPEKVYSNISRVGNTSSASIPICLDECVRGGRIKKGDLILMSAFGAGVTWGAVLMRW